MKQIVQWIGCWLLVLGSVGAWGQTTYDWLNTAPDANWRTGAAGARWDPGGLWDQPPYGRLRFNNNHQVIMTNNVPAPYDQFQVEFGANATTARTIGGNTLRFFDFGGTWPRIGNLSTANHTINLPIQVSDGSASAWGGLELVTNNGSLTIGGGINGTNKNVYIYGNNVAVSTARSVFLNSVISGSGFVNISQFGLLRYNANQTYTGQTQIDNGELWIESGGDISGGGGIIVGNTGQPGNVAKLWLSNPTGGTTFSRPITINQGDATTREIGGLNTSGTHTFSGNITNNSTNGLLVTALSAGGTLVLSGANSGANTNPYNYQGAGTIILSGNSTYQGISNIAGGTIVRLGGAGSGTASPLGNTTNRTEIANGGTLDLNGFSLVTNEPLTINGNGIGGNGVLINNPTVATNVDWGGVLTLGSNSLIVANNGSINFTSTNATGGTGNFTLTLSGLTGGSIAQRLRNSIGSIVKDGTGVWVINRTGSQNDFTGTVSINNGILRLSGTNNFPLRNNVDVTIANTAGATLDLNNLNQQIGSLAGGGTTGGAVTLGSGTLTIGGTVTQTFSGNISGTGGLTKQGTGTQILAGSNDYTGPTTVSAGVLTFNSNTAISSSSTVNLNGGTLRIGPAPTGTLNAGTFNLGGNATINLAAGSNSYNLTFAGWGGTFTGTLTISGWSGTAGKEIYLPGLSATELAQINFTGYGTGAQYDNDNPGRIIPAFVYETRLTGSGNFSTAASWSNGVPPSDPCSGNPVTIIVRGTFALTQNSNITLTNIEVQSGASYAATANTITLCPGANFNNDGIVNFTGTSSVVCNGVATFGGTASSANFGLNNLTVNAATTLTTSPTIRGSLIMNAAASSILNLPPEFGSASTLVYRQGGTISIGIEWATGNGTANGLGLPNNVSIENTTTLDFPIENRGCTGNFTITSGNARLNNTFGADLYVAGNFTNNSTFTHRDRAVFLVGSNSQTLNGILNGTTTTNCLPFLLIDKSGGTVTLNTTVNVTGTLTLTNGTITLGSSNLQITSGTAIAGAPFSNTKMIIADGSGQLVFTTATNASYLFPIGDNTSGADYSPITINLTAGAGAGNTIGMRVVDAAVPASPLNTPSAAAHYLTRYWVPSSSGFTSISWNGTATYAAAGDVVGTAANIRFSVWHPAPENVWMDYGGAPVGQTLTGGTNITDLNSLSSTAFITGREDAPKLFYRSVGSGNWGDLSTWETATDAAFTTPSSALVPPSALNSNGIVIRNAHTVTINVATTLDQAVVVNGAILVKANAALNINNGIGIDLEIQNGGLFRHATTSGNVATFVAGSEVWVRSGGTIEVTQTAGGPSIYGTGANMFYETDAIFDYRTNNPFLTSSVTYFLNAGPTVIPIFRLSVNLSLPVGAGPGNNTIVNGLFQANGTVTWQSGGTKTFRNGITGTANITQDASCGEFFINGTTSVLGGSGTISLNTAGLQITAGTCTMTSGKPIAGTGTFTVNNGATLNAGTNALSGSAHFTLAAGGTLISASSTGVNGNITTSGTRTFTAGANYTFNGTAAQTTGNLMGTTIGALTINNPTTVTLTNTNHVASTLNLQAGTFRAGIGTTLQIAAGGTVNGTGGNVSTNSNGEGGTIEFLANGAVNGTPTLWNVTIGNSGGGVNFANNATIFNRFTINAAGAINPNAPTYANGSTLVYNTGGSYDRSIEWGQATAGAAGFPWHVEVMGSTIVNTGTVVPPRLAISGDLTIGAATNNNELRMNSLAIPLEVSGNLTIGSSTSQGNRLTLSDAPGGDLILQGNFTRFRNLNFFDNEAYTGNRGRRIIFSGSIPSSIDVVDPTPANRVQAFHHMVMNKTGGAGVQVDVPLLMIENELTFEPSGGIIHTRSEFGPGSPIGLGLLVLRRPANVSGTPSATAMVNGMMRKETRLSSLTGGPSAMNGTFSGDFTFPIGKTNPSVLYRPVQIADLVHGSVDTWYDAEFALEPTTDAPRSDFFLDFVQGIWANNRWEVSRGGGDGSSFARVGIFYQTAFDNWTPVFPQPNSAVAVATYQLGGWRFTKLVENFNDATPPYLEAVPEVSPGAWVYSEPLSTFSPFSIGWAFWQLLPLPVTLHSFTATLQGGDGLLRWEIDDAKDLRHFELQHSTDGQRFATLATLPRQEATGYSYRHRMLSAGVHHYRLAIVEKDGRRHYSRIEMLQVGTQRTLISGLLHNPVVGGQAIVRLQSATAQSAQAVVIDMAGRVLLRQQVQLMAGANQVSLSMLPLPAGHYRMLFRTADGVEKVMPLLR